MFFLNIMFLEKAVQKVELRVAGSHSNRTCGGVVVVISSSRAKAVAEIAGSEEACAQSVPPTASMPRVVDIVVGAADGEVTSDAIGTVPNEPSDANNHKAASSSLPGKYSADPAMVTEVVGGVTCHQMEDESKDGTVVIQEINNNAKLVQDAKDYISRIEIERTSEETCENKLQSEEGDENGKSLLTFDILVSLVQFQFISFSK